MLQLTIDGQPIQVPEGSTVLQACRAAGIKIPTLCDHPSLKPSGGCRLCVVEVEGARTLQTSCTLPASDGMVVRTDTPALRRARRFVLSLIFSERNHFCMYCQKSGTDCELQNAAYGEGMTHWPLQPAWNPFQVDASNPYFTLDHNRCILCRRCVRACEELVGNFTLNLENRGASSMIVADYGLPIGQSSCVSCGVCVQICPTGAFIDRHSAYLGQDSQTERVPSVCVACSVGCGVELVVRDNQLIRIDGDWDAPVNRGVLCEIGRYEPLADERERIRTPLVREAGALRPASWEEAYARLAERLVPLAKGNGGRSGARIAALASTRLTAEALHAFTQLFGGGLHGSPLASIEEHLTTGLAADSSLEGTLEDLKASDCVVAVGVDLVQNHRVAGFFIKRNLPHGTCLIVINPYQSEMAHIADYSLHPAPGTDRELLQAIMAAIVQLGMDKAAVDFDAAQVDLQSISRTTGIPADTITAIGRTIASASRPVFVYGKGIQRQSDGAVLRALETLARMNGCARLINTKGKANSLAAHAYGLDRPFQPQGCQAAFLALGDDHAYRRLVESLESVPFLAVQASFRSALTDRADVVLPVETWAEQEGHFLNLDGRLQRAQRALAAPPGVRSNLAALQGLAQSLGVNLNGGWREALSAYVSVAVA